jgi:hypothetical protein
MFYSGWLGLLGVRAQVTRSPEAADERADDDSERTDESPDGDDPVDTIVSLVDELDADERRKLHRRLREQTDGVPIDQGATVDLEGWG